MVNILHWNLVEDPLGTFFDVVIFNWYTVDQFPLNGAVLGGQAADDFHHI